MVTSPGPGSGSSTLRTSVWSVPCDGLIIVNACTAAPISMFDVQRKSYHNCTMIVEWEVRDAEIAAPAGAHSPAAGGLRRAGHPARPLGPYPDDGRPDPARVARARLRHVSGGGGAVDPHPPLPGAARGRDHPAARRRQPAVDHAARRGS